MSAATESQRPNDESDLRLAGLTDKQIVYAIAAAFPAVAARLTALERERDELRAQLLAVAKLAAPTPQFNGPLGVWEAEKIRDDVLARAALTSSRETTDGK